MRRRVFVLTVFAVGLCRSSSKGLCEYDACESSISSIDDVHDEIAALQVHVGSIRGSTSPSQEQQPQFTTYHGPSKNLCAGTSLRIGPSAGYATCEKRCAEHPSCKFFSFWWTGHLNWCKLSEACDTFEQQKHSITIFQRQDLLPDASEDLEDTRNQREQEVLAKIPIFQAQAEPKAAATPQVDVAPEVEEATPKLEAARKTEATSKPEAEEACAWIERMLEEEVPEFGDEAIAKALKDNAAKASQALTDAIENAEVAETKRAVYDALSRLRKSTIEEFDMIANNETEVIDIYNSERHFRKHLLEPALVEVSRHEVPEFGDEATAEELHDNATKLDEALASSLKKDEEAETKQAAYDALVTLRTAIISEFDTIANNETEAIDAYNLAHHYQEYLNQYGLLEVVAFGNETTVEELQKNAIDTRVVLVHAVQKAEVAVMKEAVFEQLMKLREATIKEYDTIAWNETGAIDDYNAKHDFSDLLTSFLQSAKVEPFGSKDKLKELQKNSSTTEATLVNAIANASVAAIKAELWQDLKLLRTATITEYDTIAYNETRALDAYNVATRYSTANPFGK